MSDVSHEDKKFTSMIDKKWEEKFEILNKIGSDEAFIYSAMKSDEYNRLSFKEKQKISFNIWAFLFGPLYYFSKKMWAKGSVILGSIWLLASFFTLIESIIGLTLPNLIYWVPSAVICAQLANYDYFRKVVHDENMWPGLPSIFSKPVGLIGFPVAALILLLGLSTLSPGYVAESKSQTLADVSGMWRADADGAMVSISLNEDNKVLSINGTQIPVSVQSFDPDNHIFTLGVVLANGKKVSWTLRQIFAADGSFTLQMTLHDGTQDHLSYVRDL